MIDDALEEHKHGLAGIQESRLMHPDTGKRGNQTITLTKGTYIHAHARKHPVTNATVEGVHLCLRQKLYQQVLSSESINSRLLSVRLKGQSRNVSLVTAHAPPNSHSDELKNKPTNSSKKPTDNSATETSKLEL